MSEKNAQTQSPDRADLDQQYGSIGISAVAAAARYSGEARNPAYAPASPQPSGRSGFDTRSVFAV